MKQKYRVIDIVAIVFAFAFCLIWALPVIWLLSASFQGLSDIYTYPFHWIPDKFLLSNFINAWKQSHIATALISSVCVSSIYIVIHLFFCTSAGYVFAKYNFKLKGLLFTLILATMMIPQEVTYITIYDTIHPLVDTYWGIIIPICISGFGIFFMKQSASTIPDELLESAKIDGCGNVRTYVKIALPLLKPSISALSILAFSFIWNEYAWSNLVMNSTDKRTLPITLAMLASSSANDIKPNIILAASVIAIIPVMILFILFQKQFVESVANAGIKG